MITRVVDACYELALRQLVDEDFVACEATLVTAIDVEPGDEGLWRMRILAAYARRNQPAVDEAIARLYAQVETLLGPDADLEEETNVFLEALASRTPVVDLMELV